MRTIALSGAVLIVAAEAGMLAAHQQPLLLPVAGIVLAALLLGVRRRLGGGRIEPAGHDADRDEPGEALQHWLSSTRSQLHWSESTRADWDRHWRPMLARHFEAATGQRQAVDPAGFDATGRLLFGEALWAWVQPGNVTAAGAEQPGPGRAVLEEILQRLERP